VGFVVDKVALGQVFSEYFGFPCQFSFHRLLHIHHHHLSSDSGTIGQLMAGVPSELSFTTRQETKKGKNVTLLLSHNASPSRGAHPMLRKPMEEEKTVPTALGSLGFHLVMT
jgi:hypothetical protein